LLSHPFPPARDSALHRRIGQRRIGDGGEEFVHIAFRQLEEMLFSSSEGHATVLSHPPRMA